MTGAVVGALVAVGVVILGLLLVVAVRRRRAPVLGDVSRLATTRWPGTPAAGADQVGPAALPDAGAVPGVAELLGRNDQIGAVKAYRDQTGAGLRESSQAVRRWIVAHRGTADADGVRRLLAQGQTIQAIKLYRQQTGVGLADAKRAVEQLAAGTDLAAAGPAGDPADPAELRRLVRSGRKIQAIKLYRQRTGASLREAKETVERLGATGPLPAQHPDQGPGPDPAQGPDLSEVRQLLHAGRKIEAIKVYRQLTGVGLREAKAAVERGSW
ncbi:hypothetical protein AB0I55_04995 [Actinocatenispora sera]|uniref:hypothetical protein n=1 Tax=Actinocatenispora sera TaxID=390989 RepID=UPI0033F3EF27